MSPGDPASERDVGSRKQGSAGGAASPGRRAEMLAQTPQADSLHPGVQANKGCSLTELVSRDAALHRRSYPGAGVGAAHITASRRVPACPLSCKEPQSPETAATSPCQPAEGPSLPSPARSGWSPVIPALEIKRCKYPGPLSKGLLSSAVSPPDATRWPKPRVWELFGSSVLRCLARP